MKSTKKISRKVILGILATIGVLLQSILLWTLSSLTYGSDKVSIKEGIADFSDFPYGGKLFYPYGEYEFYYDQWLVTDKIENPIQDGMIEMPMSWSGKNVTRNNVTIALPQRGYASYRITLENIKPGKTFSVAKQDYGDSLRIFFNDKLVYQYGILSKEKDGNSISGKNHIESSFVVPESGRVVMTIEVGNNGHGGLQEVPILYPGNTASRTSSISEAIIFFSFGIILTSIITAFIFFISDFKNLDYHYLILLTLLLFLFTFFSEDGLILCNRFFLFPNYYLFEHLHYLFTACFIYLLIFCNAITKEKADKKDIIAYILLFLTSLCSWFFLYGTSYVFLAYLLLAIPLIIFFRYFFSQKNVPTFLSILNLLSLSFTFGDILFEITKTIKPYRFSSKAIIASVSSIRALIFIAYFIIQFILLLRAKKEYIQLHEEKIKILNNTLKEEIKPHYLFNMLSVIRYQYHKNQKDGDEVMALFSRNFRQSIENMEKDMIPFEKEIEMINQYIELENKRFEKPFEVIFDLEFTDYEIPPLTIEPIIENSVNYSKVNEKEDGYILLSSFYEKQKVTIIIEDNGIGYNQSTVKNTSIGQKNLKERLRMALDATVTVESIEGKGTRTTISFPYQRDEEASE